MNAFSDSPFAAGSVYGWRAFAADEDLNGLLTGPMYPQFFLPGENRAFCLSPSNGNPIDYHNELHRDHLRVWNNELAEHGRAVTMPDFVGQWHEGHVGRIGCGCGFYCYWDNQDGMYSHHHNSIEAVVEGWGHITYGNRGFRCSKMKIVGLVKPPNLASKPPLVLTTPDEKRWLALAWSGSGVLSILFFSVGVPWLSLLPVGLASVGSAVIVANRGTRRKLDRVRQHIAVGPRISEGLWSDVVARYPDAQVFNTMAEAKAVFPPTNPFEQAS